MRDWLKMQFQKGVSALTLRAVVEGQLQMNAQQALSDLQARVPGMNDEDFQLYCQTLQGLIMETAWMGQQSGSSDWYDGQDFNYVAARLQHESQQAGLQQQQSQQRVAGLQFLLHHAQVIRAQSGTPDPQGLAEGAPQSPGPLDDLGKAQLFMSIQDRHMKTMLKAVPGQASQAVVDELSAIHDAYRELLDHGPPEHPFYDAAKVESYMADVLEKIAMTYDWMRETDKAREFHGRAADAFEEVGDAAEAERIRGNMTDSEQDASGDFDTAIQRVQGELESRAEGTMEHGMSLVELGELYMRGGDDYSAEQYLTKALAAFESMGLTDPSDQDPRKVLEESMTGIRSGEERTGPTEIEKLVASRGAYQRIYQCLTSIYTASEDFEKAGLYSEKLGKLTANELDTEEIARLMQSILSDLSPDG